MATERAITVGARKSAESMVHLLCAWALTVAGAWSAVRALAFSDGQELLAFGALAFTSGLLKLRLERSDPTNASRLRASVPVVIASMPFLGPAASVPAMLAALAETVTNGPDQEKLGVTLFRVMRGPAAALAGGSAYVLSAGRCATGITPIAVAAFLAALAAYTAVDLTGRLLGRDACQVRSIALSVGTAAAAAWLLCVWRQFCPAQLMLYTAIAIGGVWATSEMAYRKSQPIEPATNETMAGEPVEAPTENTRLSLVDPLTGLANDRYLYMFLQQEIGRNVRKNLPVSLLLLDIDDFQNINEDHGNEAADAAMVEIGRVLKSCVREYDIIARYSSDEFAIVLPEARCADACERAEKIREQVAAHVFGEDLSLRVSAGVATYPEHGMTPDDLVSSAHHALNRAKLAGKNRVTSCMDVAVGRLSYGT